MAAKTQDEVTKAITSAVGKETGPAFDNLEETEPAGEPVVEEAVLEAGEGEDEGTEEAAVQEAVELILGKFKNQDELTKGYEESEKRGTLLSQENAELKRNLEAFQQALAAVSTIPTQPATPEPSAEDLNQQLLNEIFTNPAQVIDKRVDQRYGERLSRMEGMLSAMIIQAQAKEKLGDQYPAYENALGQAFRTVPQWMYEPNGLDKALVLADGIRKAELLEQAKTEAAQTALAGVQAKKDGETLPSTGGRPSPTSQIDPTLFEHTVKLLMAGNAMSREEAEERARKSKHVKKGR